MTLVVNPPAPTGGFTLGASPSSRSITPGQSTTFDATVTRQTGYTGSGTFSVTGLPTGADGSFSPAGYSNGSGQSTLTVTTDASTPAGTYPLTITATDTNGTPVQSTNVSLTVTPAARPDFALAATPGTLVVKRGKSGSYNVTVTPSGGFNETVALSVQRPAGFDHCVVQPGLPEWRRHVRADDHDHGADAQGHVHADDHRDERVEDTQHDGDAESSIDTDRVRTEGTGRRVRTGTKGYQCVPSRTLSYPFVIVRRTCSYLSFSRTRFAPAPTGFLHLGHVLNAHHVWTTARPARRASPSAH